MLQIEGLNLTEFIPGRAHGIASYIRHGINAKPIQKSPDGQIEWIIIIEIL